MKQSKVREQLSFYRTSWIPDSAELGVQGREQEKALKTERDSDRDRKTERKRLRADYESSSDLSDEYQGQQLLGPMTDKENL